MPQPTVVASFNSGTFTSRTVSTGTIPSWTPQVGDVVVILIQLPQSGTVTFTLPAGWLNPLGGATVATSPAGANMVAVYHVVTAAEATAVTTAWTLTNLLDVSKQGSRVAFVVRGADPNAPIDVSAVASGNSASLGIPGVTPTKSDSLVVGGGGGNSFSTSETVTAPTAPWSTTVGTLSGTNIRFVVQCSTPTVAGSPFAGVALTISRTDDWTAVTIAFAAAGGSGFFNLF